MLDSADAMRKLKDYEEVGLIGYPCDGEYIAMVANNKHDRWLLGGELCGLNGAVVADQAAALHRYYPQRCRLVLATIRHDWIIAVRDYGLPQTGERPELPS
ncbi:MULTISPECIES: hypothetical protein [unclassified Mesorhizobium]|uniref:hypothetical protein n=1 Tax=unclassified Mesorhizobium TaxID=325217 RepID=UPI000F75CA42|nr:MULTISPECIES: hypothetical protein [unclassified Mesorhizobium]AZO28623.1 hypothetical protein EJ071_15335 [Mesorhizobium sp. M1B.F.Ca.ET.045.04.1.1]RWA62508.1 MAG: hypothetical protein EOQ29_30305 [Mesorhizobium sp.]RWA84465.1 MAG: hypothetical protein EOQ30_09130 [Mesorhizobium sp.]RWB15877.1 MAG: hypothetical protein EOQ40_27830 [Mesorhizobium sp.]RWE01586.1 MAG: hypothetical protein EOS40_11135 [Mesorhizobium sp.]